MPYYIDMPLPIGSFTDELEKIAASIDQLHQAYRRLGGMVKIPWAKNRWGHRQMPLLSPTYISNNKRLATKSLQQNSFGLPEDLARQQVDEAFKSPFMRASGGKIRMPKGGGEKVLKQLGVPNAATTPEGKKGVNVMLGVHEGFERQIRPHNVRQFAGHLSPDVVLKEHNMVTRLTGKGSQEARRAMKGVRAYGGEASALEDMMQQAYGPRAKFTFGEGAKIPKAMRKDFTRKFVANQIP